MSTKIESLWVYECDSCSFKGDAERMDQAVRQAASHIEDDTETMAKPNLYHDVRVWRVDVVSWDGD